MNASKNSAPFTKGVNLTGWLEHRPADQIDSSFFTLSDLENIRALGCDVVRVPIHFERFCSPENGWLIPGNILSILDNLAQWAEKLRMYVIFDFHNRTDVDSVTSPDAADVLIPVWTQIARRYKNASEYIIYELMNEPHGIEIPVWNGIIARVHRAVREIDGGHYIAAGGADWNSLAGMKALPDFGDDRTLLTFHFYDPHTFTHQGAPWCHMERVTGLPFPYDPEKMPPVPDGLNDHERSRYESYPADGTEERIRAVFDEYERISSERSMPVFCGEFGCNMFGVKREYRVKWYEIITGLLEERGIARISWDYYGGFGIFREPFRKKDAPGFPEGLDTDIVRALRFTGV